MLEHNSNNNKLKIWYTNADSLHNKLTELNILINNSQHKPDVIAVTEAKSKRTGAINIAEYSLPEYRLFTNDFEKDIRGIIIYIKSNLISDVVKFNDCFTEYLFIKINQINTHNSLIMGCVYRSPSSSTSNDEHLCELLNDVFSVSNNNNVIVVGDFNYPHIDWEHGISTNNNNSANLFLDTLKDNFIKQNVSKATRARKNDTPHLLDLVLTNNDFVRDITHMSPLGNSDHNILDINCELYYVRKVTNGIKFNFNKGNYIDLASSLNLDWDKCFADDINDINSMWNKFKHIVTRETDKFIPKTNNFDSWKKNSWSKPLSRELRKLIKQKHRAWNRYIETKDPIKLFKYKKARNVVTKEIKRLRTQEHHNISMCCKDNPKKFWKYISKKTRISEDIGELLYDNDQGSPVLATTDQDKAELLCKSFASVFTRETDLEDTIIANTNEQINSMKFIKIDTEIILAKLSKINVNKSAGPDGIFPRVLFEAKDVLAYPLKILFDTSLRLKMVPEDWRAANVIPVYKKGDRKQALNYRPISLTSVVCKLIESIIRDHILEHFFSNHLFSTQQYGFLKGRNTVLQLIKIFDMWTDMLEEGGQIDVIYTDLEKAFDKVPHNRLLLKLQSYKINIDLIDWIRSFLSNRNLRVKINNTFSNWFPVLSGIPQGSILGPLLFIIYINDLPEECDLVSHIFLYADDAKFFRHIKSPADNKDLQISIDKVQTWTKKWQLKLNIDKCTAVSYGRHVDTSHVYYLNNGVSDLPLQRLESFKDLGVTFDSNLSFKYHIAEKINKANSMLGIIKRNFTGIKYDAFLLLYKTLVRSHLEYANSVWNPHHTQDIKALEQVQMRATKILPSLKNKPYHQRLRILNLPTLKFRRQRGDMIEVYKILNGIYDNSVKPNIPISSESYTRGNSLKIVNHRCHYDLRKYSFCNRITNVWNSLPNDIVTASSVNSFKNKLDKHWSTQELIYSWKDEITGTGSRSKV